MQRQYVGQQPGQPPGRQYVRGANGAVYEVPPQQQYVRNDPPPPPRTQYMAQPPPANAIARAAEPTPIPDRIQTAAKPGFEGQLVANAVLVGSLLSSFRPDGAAASAEQARILSLQLVAFGCHLSALALHAAHLQRGGGRSSRGWAHIAQALGAIGLALLAAAAAVGARARMGAEHGDMYLASATVMIVLAVLPALCGVGLCLSGMAGRAMRGMEGLWQ